jgi:putative NADPH-quinone reductase
MAAICIIQGHPHAANAHLCDALAMAYAEGAEAAGHKVVLINIAELDFPLLRNPADLEQPPLPVIDVAQEAIRACEHLVIIYPLWLGGAPALMKGFFEQLACNGFLVANSDRGWPRKMLKGRSARLIVTMGMPAIGYRLLFGAYGVRGFASCVLGLAGFRPIRQTLIGGTGILSAKAAMAWLGKVRRLGTAAL